MKTIRFYLHRLFLSIGFIVLAGCQSISSKSVSLYDQIGGANTVEKVVDNFIEQIEFDQAIYQYFKESDIERFRTKLIEQLCSVTGGPCQYSGDSMKDVHAGMNVNEKDFNRTVELLIAAMEAADLSEGHQNEILKILAPMRKDIIYI